MNVNTLAVSHYTENKQSKLNTGSGKYIRSYIINQGRATPEPLAALRKRGEVEHPGTLCVGKVRGSRGRWRGRRQGCPWESSARHARCPSTEVQAVAGSGVTSAEQQA